MDLGFRVSDLGFRVYGLGFWAHGVPGVGVTVYFINYTTVGISSFPTREFGQDAVHCALVLS